MAVDTSARAAGLATGLSLLVPITLSTMAIVLLAPILPQLMAEYAHVAGAAYLVPMVLTMPALCVALLSPVAGMLGDRFARRRLLIVSLAVYAVVGIAPVFLTDLKTIIASRVAVGMAEALIMVLTTTMIGDVFSGTVRDRWLAAQTAVASLSALLFFNIGGSLGTFGWRTPFWVYTSALAMLAAVLLFTWEPRNDEVVAAPASSASWAEFPWGRLSPILAISVFGSILFYTVQIQASQGLTLLGLTNPARIGFLTSIASLGVPLGTMLFARLTQVPATRLLIFEFAILAIGFTLMAQAASVSAFLIGCAINQLGAGLLLPTLLVWAMSQLHFEIRSRGAGLWTGAFSLGQFLSAIAIAFLTQLFGGLPSAFLAMAIGSFVACAATIVIVALRRATPRAVTH